MTMVDTTAPAYDPTVDQRTDPNSLAIPDPTSTDVDTPGLDTPQPEVIFSTPKATKQTTDKAEFQTQNGDILEGDVVSPAANPSYRILRTGDVIRIQRYDWVGTEALVIATADELKEFKKAVAAL